MRRDRFRLDPATWVAVTLAVLLPTGLLLLISSLTLTGMSISLSDLLEEPHLERVRARGRMLGAEIDRRLDELRDSLASVLAEGDPSGPTPEAAAAVVSLEWSPVRTPRDRPGFSDERSELADVVLRSLLHTDAPVRRTATLEDLAGLPPELEDELGFSYALEASLELDAPLDDAIAVLRSPSLDRAALDAWFSAAEVGEITIPGWALPLRPELAGGRGMVASISIDPADSSRFRLLVPTSGAGDIVATIATVPFLESALAATVAIAEPPEGIFFAVRPVGAAPEMTGRVWATWAVPPPFAHHYELATGTESAEPPVPLALLNRLEGIHLLWGGLLAVALALGMGLVLATLASRRVRRSKQQDDFLRLVSHELRTPIASIRMIAETLALERVRDDDERRTFLRQLEAESDRLTDLVERVLEFGRKDAGVRSREVVTDPGEIVQETVRLFTDREREQHRRGGRESPIGAIEIRSSQRFHPVLLDREAVAGVLMNLLSNARKYAPAGSPVVVTVGEESRRLFISVRDHGPGIGKRDRKRIFRSFYRGEVDGAKPGFGLGLAYCHRVARDHRGRMSVDGAPGGGSTFTLEIPLDPHGSEGADDGTDPRRRG